MSSGRSSWLWSFSAGIWVCNHSLTSATERNWQPLGYIIIWDGGQKRVLSPVGPCNLWNYTLPVSCNQSWGDKLQTADSEDQEFDMKIWRDLIEFKAYGNTHISHSHKLYNIHKLPFFISLITLMRHITTSSFRGWGLIKINFVKLLWKLQHRNGYFYCLMHYTDCIYDHLRLFFCQL